MKIKNVICELKSGASAYSSAYKLIRSLYPAFTFSFIGVSILFILASLSAQKDSGGVYFL